MSSQMIFAMSQHFRPVQTFSLAGDLCRRESGGMPRVRIRIRIIMRQSSDHFKHLQARTRASVRWRKKWVIWTYKPSIVFNQLKIINFKILLNAFKNPFGKRFKFPFKLIWNQFENNESITGWQNDRILNMLFRNKLVSKNLSEERKNDFLLVFLQS